MWNYINTLQLYILIIDEMRKKNKTKNKKTLTLTHFQKMKVVPDHGPIACHGCEFFLYFIK